MPPPISPLSFLQKVTPTKVFVKNNSRKTLKRLEELDEQDLYAARDIALDYHERNLYAFDEVGAAEACSLNFPDYCTLKARFSQEFEDLHGRRMAKLKQIYQLAAAGLPLPAPFDRHNVSLPAILNLLERYSLAEWSTSKKIIKSEMKKTKEARLEALSKVEDKLARLHEPSSAVHSRIFKQ